jgi:hypothetical protein
VQQDEIHLQRLNGFAQLVRQLSLRLEVIPTPLDQNAQVDIAQRTGGISHLRAEQIRQVNSGYIFKHRGEAPGKLIPVHKRDYNTRRRRRLAA